MAPEQTWNPQRLNGLAHGYWSSFALHAAVELGLTERLAQGPAPAPELARDLGVDPRALEMLLVALCGLELVVEKEGSYALEPSARQFFTPGSPRDMSGVILHLADLVPDWAQLAQGVRQGKAVAGKWSQQRRQRFYRAMRDLARQQAPGLAARLGLAPGQHLLDLGGGPGVYGFTFADEVPGLEVTVFDLAQSRPSFEEEARLHPQAHRVRRRDGDYNQDSLGGPYQVVWISQVLHGEDPDTCRLILNKAAAALEPGGTLWVQEFLVEPGGHPFPALFSLNMLLLTRGGQGYRAEELARFLAEAGLSDIEHLGPTQEGGPASLMRARKP